MRRNAFLPLAVCVLLLATACATQLAGLGTQIHESVEQAAAATSSARYATELRLSDRTTAAQTETALSDANKEVVAALTTVAELDSDAAHAELQHSATDRIIEAAKAIERARRVVDPAALDGLRTAEHNLTEFGS